MINSIKIETYSVFISRSGFTNFGSQLPNVRWLAQIQLVGDNWKVFVSFVHDSDEIPMNFRSEKYQGLFLFLPICRYEAVLDLIRNEQPVMVSFNDKDLRQAVIGVAHEPVGETEMCCTAMTTGTSTDAKPSSGRGFDPFEEHSDSHAMSNSYALALCAHYIYGGEALNAGGEFLDRFRERFEPWLMHGTGGSVRFDLVSDESLIGGTGLQAVVMSNDRYIIVAFRGTQTIFSPLPLDWMTNAAFGTGPVPPTWSELGVLIHGGWLQAIDKAYDELLQLINAHRDGGDKPIWLTGHSLGGSLSMIFGLRLQTTGDYSVQGVHTYGAPMTGGARFDESYANQGLSRRTQRWVNNDDIVPKLPLPFVPGPNYEHVGSLNMINSTGTISLGTTPTTSPILSFEDHQMKTYASLIGASMPEVLVDQMPLIE